MKKLALSIMLLLPALALAAPTGVVNGLHYNTVEFSYAAGDVDAYPSLDFDGIMLRGSVLISENTFVTGSLMSVASDPAWWTDGAIVFPGKLEISDLTIGVGARFALQPSADLTATIGLISREIELAGASDDDAGLLLRVGLRGAVTPRLEVRAGIAYADLFDESVFVYDGQVAFQFAERWALVGGVQVFHDPDADFWHFGARYSF